ncbi:MAG: acyltransferase [Verrucomicrobiota bacterium]
MDIRLLVGSLLAYTYNGWLGRIPFRSIRLAFLRVYLGAIGRGSGVQMGCRFLNGRKVHFGERNVINFNCMFDGRHHEIRTGSDVSIGADASILTLGHDPQDPEFGLRGGPVTIGDRVWIGYRAMILPGVSIGEGAVVAAGAVVSRDIDPYTIVAGVPAVKVGVRTTDLKYELNYRPLLV